ncbi:hypothetical protein [Citrobacter freundii]|uniref:hypothetical protein n=1 Tax=Citrobacter freundii TaxID=546 RepID=UPI0032C07AC1
MNYIYVSKERQKGLPKGRNFAIDLNIDPQDVPPAVTRQLATLTSELTENPFLTQSHAESLWRRFSDLLGNVRVLMSDHTGRVSRQYNLK